MMGTPSMDATLLSVGTYQPIPFPAPVALLQALLVIGFFTHALPMNVALTGGLVSAILLLKGGKDETSHASRAGRQLAASLPIFTTAAITQGIVPLLFLQVLYGPLVYGSSIVMALPWISVLLLITLAYYGLYIYNYGKQKMGIMKAPWVLIGSSLLFIVVAFIFSNNMTLMLTPEKFLPLYQHSPAGANLNLTEPTLIPRYLHFVGAAFSVTSLTLGCFGLYWKKRDEAFGSWLLKLGGSGYIGITLIQTLIGYWFFWATPQGFQVAKMTSHLLNTSLGLELISLVAMGYAVKKSCSKAFTVGLVAATLLIAGMVYLRHSLRLFMTDQYMEPLMTAQPVVIQWPILILFVILALLMVGYFVWLGKTVFNAYNKDA
jgi:hypothetical protein